MKPIVRRPIVASLLAASLVFVAAGCAKKSAEMRPASATPPPASHVETAPAPAPAPKPAPAPAPAPKVQASDFKDLYFDFDRYDLGEPARAALDVDAKLLRDHTDLRIRIEAHCDERGTVEYNQALGERRASAARDYLISDGVSGVQIETISYGKERPFCTEHEESCWAKNRCDHMALRSNPT